MRSGIGGGFYLIYFVFILRYRFLGLFWVFWSLIVGYVGGLVGVNFVDVLIYCL